MVNYQAVMRCIRLVPRKGLWLLFLVFAMAAKGDWLIVTNKNSPTFFESAENPFRPDAALRVVADEPRGFVVLYERGVERWSGAGQREWSARYLNNDFAKLDCLTVDPQGNTYVAGKLYFTGELGGMGMTNNSLVPGPNGHVQAFVAKLDPQGKGLWYQLFESAGPTIWSLAMDLDGGVVFAGRIGGANQLGRFGNLVFSETAFSSAFAAKIAANGAPQWVKVYNQFTANRSTCEANSIAVDSTGIYIGGVASFSVQFGSQQLQTSGNWIGKLGLNGTEQWIRATGGTLSQGPGLLSQGGKVWYLLWRDRILQRWDSAGTLVASIGVAGNSERDSASVTQFALNQEGEPMVVGSSVGYSFVGTNMLTAGAGRPMVWYGQWDAAGNLLRSRILATTTNANPATSQDKVGYNAFGATPAGDLILAGNFNPGMKFLGNSIPGPGGFLGSSFLARMTKPALVPELKQQPVAALEVDSGGSLFIGVQVDGPAPFTFQWRKNGEPLSYLSTNVLQITNVTLADAGLYDVVVSNAHGEVVSSPCVFTVRPPFRISGHPSDRLVILSGEISGTDIGLASLTQSSLLDKTLSCHITNTTSARYPLDGRFKIILSSSSYQIPADGALGAHAGSLIPGFLLGEQYFGMRLRRMVFDGRPDGALNLTASGQFDFHLDIAAADGCCMVGEYSLSGGAKTATFRVATTSFVPNGGFQWFKDGVAIQGATASSLHFANVVEGDAGLYHCVVTDRGYSETSLAARLDVRVGTIPNPPVKLDVKTFLISPGSLTVPSWPAGYVLQRTETLSPAVWQTIATAPPAVVDIQNGSGFLRLWSEGLPPQ